MGVFKPNVGHYNCTSKRLKYNMKNLLYLKDINLFNKYIVIRVDFNVPMKNGIISSATKIKRSLSTIKFAIEKGAKIIIMSHFGNPKEGYINQKYSLKPIANYFSSLINKPVKFTQNYNKRNLKKREILFLENVRFNLGEKSNNINLSKKLANLCDIFIMDAFGVSHRIHSSTCGIAEFAPISCAGFLLEEELTQLKINVDKMKSPILSIIGGSKISTKITLLDELLEKVDDLVIGGGIANTFLLAKGLNIGSSIHESNLIHYANNLMNKKVKCNIHLPVDVYVTKDFSSAKSKFINQISKNEKILDLGKKTLINICSLIQRSKTIILNGPVGAYEMPLFSHGTFTILDKISKTSSFSIAGGGDTIASIENYKFDKFISYISTGGGAFLEYLKKNTLPILKFLEKSNEKNKNINYIRTNNR